MPESSTSVVYIATALENEVLLSCGGSIISSKTILTCARCLLPPLETFVVAGTQSVNLEQLSESQGQTRIVTKKMKLHEKFRLNSEYDHDVALVSFDEELTFGASASPIKFTPTWIRLNLAIGMFGWERSAAGSQIMQLKWVNTSMACRSMGASLTEPGAWDNLDVYTDGVLFVKDKIGSASMCYGDAGSPLVWGGRQIGIASFGVDQNCRGLNAMTSIRRYFKWIEKNKSILEGKPYIERKDEMTQQQYKTVQYNNYVRNRQAIPSKTLSHWSSMESRIRNGTHLVSPETYPFLVAIARYKSDDPANFSFPYCTGSILTQWIVLTVAHCIINEMMIVYAGIVDLSDFTKPGASFQAVRVNESRQHTFYTKPYNDVGLLRLLNPLTISSNVTPVCQLAQEVPPTGQILLLAGWGMKGNETRPGFPSWVNVTVTNPPLWYRNPRSIFLLDTISKPSACSGDSGAPYFTEEHEVVGIHSFKDTYYGDEEDLCSNADSGAMSTSWLVSIEEDESKN